MPDTTPSTRYAAAVLSTAAADFGSAIPLGTTVVGSTSREGSSAAVVYPLGDRTIIWCAPELRPRLATLEGEHPTSMERFVAEATALGGTFVGAGRNRVLTGPPHARLVDPRRLAWLDRDNADDRILIAGLIEGCADDDLAEAELDLDDLDPAILVLLAGDGSIAAYASGRPWSFDHGFDDIAVITHPEHRGQGLGAGVVAAFAAGQQARGRLMFYNCDVENIGSNRVADTVGFTVVNTVAAVSFDGIVARG